MDQILALQTNPQFNQPVKTTIIQNSTQIKYPKVRFLGTVRSALAVKRDKSKFDKRKSGEEVFY